MTKNLEEIASFGDDGKSKLQFDPESGDLYANDRKISYDLSLTWWQNLLAILVSLSVIAQSIISVIQYFYSCH